MSGDRIERVWGRPVRTRLTSEETVLVAPKDGALRSFVEDVQQGIEQRVGQRLRILAGDEVGPEEYAKYHMILIGSMLNNPVMLRLYNRRRCFVDAVYPGEDGYFVKSLADPFGHGRNFILVGGSTTTGVERACAAFLALVPEGSPDLGRIHAVESMHSFGEAPNEEEIPGIVAGNVDTWTRGWTSAPMGTSTSYALNYYLTDDHRWADLLVGTLCGSVQAWADLSEYDRSQHVFFRLDHLFHMWDLVEGSEVFQDEDRVAIANFLLDLTRHVSRVSYFWPESNPEGGIRQNHSTFVAWNMTAAIDYFRRRYGITEFDSLMVDVERIFSGQGRSHKPNDDAGRGYVWLVPQHTIGYFLWKDDYRYLEEGYLRTLAELVAVTTDNRRSECTYGDAGGYSPWSPSSRMASLGILSLASWYYDDGQYRWAYDWLSGGGRRLSSSDLLIGPYGNEVPASPPDDLCGVRAIPLDEAPIELAVRYFEDRQWTTAPQPWRPDPEKGYFDKLAFRPGFDPQDEYLMLDGTGTYAHGHEDGNAIIRLTWKDRMWLMDGDYIRATPKVHNSVVVIRDGENGTLPPLAALNLLTETERYGFTQTEIVGYNGVDWRRNILWGKGRYFAVVDELEAREEGDYRFRCLWRVLGDVTLEEDCVAVDQAGVRLRIDSADDSRKEVRGDECLRSNWGSYEHADGVVRVLHQKKRCHLGSGERAFYLNLLCVSEDPEDEGYALEQVTDGAFRLTGRGEQSILGIADRGLSLGDLTLTAAFFHAGEDHLMAAGCTTLELGGFAVQSTEPISLDINLRTGDATVEAKKETHIETQADQVLLHGTKNPEQRTFDLSPGKHTLHLADLRGKTIALSSGSLPAQCSPPAPPSPAQSRSLVPPSPAQGRSLVPPSLAQGRSLVPPSLVGKGDRGLGPIWQTALPSPATTLAVGDLHGDGRRAILVGTENGEVALISSDGEEAWRHAAESRVNRVHLRDVDGDGIQEIVVADDAANVSLLNVEGDLLWTRTIKAGIRTPKVTCVTTGDLAGNGDVSILAGTEGWFVHAFDLTGNERWHIQAKYHSVTEILAEDLDGDGKMEIAVGTEYCTPLNVMNYDGTMRWFTWEQVGSEARSTTSRNGSHLTQVAVADLDGDGIKEIIYGTGDNWVYAVRPADGAVVWEANVGGEVRGLFVGDLDGDGEACAIAGGEYGDLFRFDREGRRMWWKEIGEEIHCMAFGDVNGDGRSEIVVGVDGDRIEVYDGDGEFLGGERVAGGVKEIRVGQIVEDEPARIVCADRRGRVLLFRFGGGS